MTLTQQDRNQAASQVDPFGAQEKLTEDLPNVLRNMLREFSNRPYVPDEIELSERRIRKICDHNEMGSFSLKIHKRLTAELSDFSFKARYENDLDEEDLKEIIENPGCSLPAVQLSKSYFKNCVGYRAQSDSNGRTRKPRVLVLRINHDDVLVYDPYRFGTKNAPDDLEPSEIPKRPFIKAWKGEYETTSTLWIEQTNQKRISQFKNE